MSFRLNPHPTFRAPVPLSVPGMEQPLTLPMVFRHKTAEQLKVWLASMPNRSDPDVLHEILVSWDGMQDDDGEPVSYSYAELAKLLNNYPAAKSEIFAFYLSELTRAKRKNS